MNGEVKEIFRRMNDLIDHRFDKEYHTECDLFKDIQDLLDYITNLQQEKEINKKFIKECGFNNVQQMALKLASLQEEKMTKFLDSCPNCSKTQLIDSLEREMNENHYLRNEVRKLNNIIHEIKEYIMTSLITEWDIKNGGYISGSDLPADAITPILDIIDGGE